QSSFSPLTDLCPQQDGFQLRKQNEIQVFLSCVGSRGIVLWSRRRSMRLSVWIWPHSKRFCSGNRKKVMPIFQK
ncbi:mCG1042446, partial [Mus musculus]